MTNTRAPDGANKKQNISISKNTFEVRVKVGRIIYFQNLRQSENCETVKEKRQKHRKGS